ncbi:MAG: hypothetical protein IKE43_05855 [Coriobacteriales bacterium]|nr:hypothetical protein [Coriobacteriales bacterium]
MEPVTSMPVSAPDTNLVEDYPKAPPYPGILQNMGTTVEMPESKSDTASIDIVPLSKRVFERIRTVSKNLFHKRVSRA